MFRGKESSNRIELSRLVLQLLNFGVLGSLWLWGRGWLGVPPHTCTCTRMHVHTCMHGKHDNFMQMATPIGFGQIPEIPYDVICMYTCVHACACMCTCVGGICSPPPTPPGWGLQELSKFNST